MKLDPRTKLFLAAVANGMIFSAPLVYSLLMVVVASILLLLEGKWKFVCAFFFVYLSAGFFFGQVKNLDIGTSGTIILASLFLMYRIMPACVVLYYVVTTTKVNEFLACMSRMRISNKVTIPLIVMIRFFPTVFDESRAIGNAMRMRGIRLFSLRTLKSPVAFLEYRLVPLLVSITKIGDELSIAAVTRGLSAETKRTCVATIGFRWADFVVCAYCIVVVVSFTVTCYR
ncbi:energy-coupling factor transporter transmembrane component T [Fibrobacter sp.]|uniref:energy-coupling factor transporter transmembrane component T n=1 Tax=Fibrobacter sp. TaxID=35828 RepID=UPI0025C0F405|nr:energy-coupling factor transporter transmembrane component T [Fibrobacter sp.]MBR3073070.1 energy-coupling factor transporter transmembrane protein EcfT [Fibrobacter sp.]